jgi:hypothetical protein
VCVSWANVNRKAVKNFRIQISRRLESLYSILDAVEVCPVAFEIFERLKQEYHFRESN